MAQTKETIDVEIPTGGTTYEWTSKAKDISPILPPYEGPYTATANGTLYTENLSLYHNISISIPEYSGSYTATQNGTIVTAGKVMTDNFIVAIPEYAGSYTVTQNGELQTAGKVMTANLVVDTPVLPTYTGPYTATQNGTLATSGKQMTNDVTVNVASNGILEATFEAFKTSHRTNWGNAFKAQGALSEVESFDALNFSGSENVLYMNEMFYNCYSLISAPLINTSNVQSFASMFYYCSNLVTVPAYDTSKATDLSQMFNYCSKLEAIHMYGMKINFSISASTKFTREALVEIINNCADLTGGTARTLTMGSTNLAKLTADDIAIATAKNWTLA